LTGGLIVACTNIIEKAAYDALSASEGEYEELEDDFLFIANECQVAIEKIDEPQKAGEAAEEEGANQDVVFLKAEDDEAELALKEYREKMAALLPAPGTNFNTIFEKQNDLDANFDAFMDEEYNEDQIGELMEEEVGAEDQIGKKVLDEAVDDLIEGQKMRFRELHKDFGQTLPEEVNKD